MAHGFAHGADVPAMLDTLGATTNRDAPHAASAYAGIANTDLVAALNRKNGSTGLDLPLVCSKLAGITTTDAADALQHL